MDGKMNPFSDSKGSTCIGGGDGPRSPFPFVHVSPPPYSNSSAVGLKDKTKSVEEFDYHRHCSSDSLLMEGQPSWLDDLLNDPDNTTTQLVSRGIHRRSSSDTLACLGSRATESFDAWEEFDQKNVSRNTSIWAQNFVDLKGSNEVKLDRSTSLEDQFKKQDSSTPVSGSAERHEKEEYSQNSDAKNPASKSDTKRAKQQSAHRSRVRKLQYIAQLERTVQVLQTTGSEMSAELEFLDHQNVILNMENRALKQRLDSISQEQIIKQFEHEMLERELVRLQALCRIQEQGHMRMQQQNPKHRRTKSRDAISSNRGPFNGSVQI